MNAAVSRSYNGWEPLFLEEFSKDYFKSLKAFLEKEYAQKTVYPPKRLILNAFDLTAPKDVKAVILGQDPYINPGQAMGLAFSVPSPVPPPPSLVNIFKEIEGETGRPSVAEGGDLTCWAKQGVLLLNTSLTVVKGLSNSAQQYRLADFYRQSHFVDKRKLRKSRCFYAVGRQRPQEKEPCDKP